ncbi:MAG: 50S ribosomal protein L17 [Phycisphaerae bacterium]|nr:50S ribosomal protein L17 [Phycisphaerae bacterium]
MMRHRLARKHLGRTSSHRMAMRRNLAAALIQHGAIRTTEAKAKDVRRFVEKLITTARKNTLHARRQVLATLRDRHMYTYDEGTKNYEAEEQSVVQKLFSEIAPRYADRPGGYTRIIRVSERRIGDAGQQVILQLITEELQQTRADGAGRSRRRRARATKRHKAAATADVAEGAAEERDQVAEQPPTEEALETGQEAQGEQTQAADEKGAPVEETGAGDKGSDA